MKGTKPQHRAMSILCLSFPRENSQLEKYDTNVTMLTEEQIQRLVKIAVDEIDYDENKAEKELRIVANLTNSVYYLLAIFGYGKSMENAVRFFDEEIFIRYLHIFKKTNNEALENKEQSQA